MLDYILCYGPSFLLGTCFGIYLSYKTIIYVKEKRLW